MTIRAKRKHSRPDEFLGGVPNTDLDEDTWQAMDPEDRQRVRESGLYDVKTDAEVNPPSTASAAKKDSGEHSGS